MTREQYDKLTEYKDLLYTAKERNYVMFGSMDKKRALSALYAEIFEKKSDMLNGCGSCALREMKELAAAYYQFEQTPAVNTKKASAVNTKKTRKKKEE